jgi:pyroglutamyl-peptidase
MARPRLLITGFGPFPGFAKNPSAWLVEALADRQGGREFTLETRVLDTEWDNVALIPRLFETLQPHAMIHFGVSAGARAFHVERSAHNRTAKARDGRGAMAKDRTIRAGGSPRLDTEFPAAKLAAHLRKNGIAARTSRSAGAYLCNFLYYHSLEWAQQRQSVPPVVFVHIPPWTKGRGPNSREALLQGGVETLRFVLSRALER